MKTGWYTKKWVIILLHIAAWTLLFSLPYLLSSPGNEKQSAPKQTEGHDAGFYFGWIMNLSWVAFFYFNAYVLIPRFVYKKKYLYFTLAQLATFSWLLLQVFLLSRLFFNNSHFNSRSIFFNLLIYLFIFALSTAYQLISDKVNSDKLAQQKQNEMLKTELSLLRSQVSPHFMFNVLNNMVSLARKQSDLLEPSLITPPDAKKLQAWLVCPLYALSPRMLELQRGLTRHDTITLYLDAAQLAKDIGGACKLPVKVRYLGFLLDLLC